jgi:hypothetical protein
MSRHDREHYQQMTFRAHFYAWMALRGSTLPGGDPITGEPLERKARRELYDSPTRGVSRAAYVAMARYWLRRAAEFRTRKEAESS